MLKKNKLSKNKDMIKKRQKCEIYSRVVGYIRPVAQWNKGKKAEYADRKTYKVIE